MPLITTRSLTAVMCSCSLHRRFWSDFVNSHSVISYGQTCIWREQNIFRIIKLKNFVFSLINFISGMFSILFKLHTTLNDIQMCDWLYFWHYCHLFSGSKREFDLETFSFCTVLCKLWRNYSTSQRVIKKLACKTSKSFYMGFRSFLFACTRTFHLALCVCTTN